jgi:RimJ/RimL family protein N-acetyltransferase
MKIILRKLEEGDVALVERWLHQDYIEKWYAPVEGWLEELAKRDGEFAFLHHFIAAVDGVPIGFCQFYDCYDTRHLEEWGVSIATPREVYSIDYLIGEEEYIGRGFGKQIVLALVEKVKAAGAKTIVVDPDIDNAPSNGVLASCGFVKRDGIYFLDI